jgi:hypothetical protein
MLSKINNEHVKKISDTIYALVNNNLAYKTYYCHIKHHPILFYYAKKKNLNS